MAAKLPHATRVYKSAVVPFPVEKVWSAVRPLKWEFWALLEKSEIEGKSAEAEVGVVRAFTFTDKTVQRVKLSELSGPVHSTDHIRFLLERTRTHVIVSDLSHFLTFEMLESVPPAPYMSRITTIRLRRVTEGNATFIEAMTDFSSDASAQVTEDHKFKMEDMFKDLVKALK